MTIVTGAAAYFIIWWITLFMVLPFGVQSDRNVQEGNDLGAPTKHRILFKMGINTIIATALWLVVFIIDVYDIISIKDLTPSNRQAY